jgi:hypothetical protein
VVFEGNETDASVLDGFTITGGTGSRLVDSSVSVDFWVGGGIFFDASSGTVRNYAIVQNRVENSGGGIFCGYPCSPILIPQKYSIFYTFLFLRINPVRHKDCDVLYGGRITQEKFFTDYIF